MRILALENSVMEQVLLTQALPADSIVFCRTMESARSLLHREATWDAVVIDGILDDCVLYSDESAFRDFAAEAKQVARLVTLWLSIPPLHPIDWCHVLIKDADDWDAAELKTFLRSLDESAGGN